MRSRREVAAVASVTVCAALAAGMTWTWTGLGADPDWDTCRNWNWYAWDPCWPSTVSDWAIVPFPPASDPPAPPWTINLISEQIQILTIQASVDFGAAEAGTPPELQLVGELAIGPSPEKEIVVTITGATIKTVLPP